MTGLTLVLPLSGSTGSLDVFTNLGDMLRWALFNTAFAVPSTALRLVLTNMSLVLPECPVLDQLRSRACYEQHSDAGLLPRGAVQVGEPSAVSRVSAQRDGLHRACQHSLYVSKHE
jgi:hypothetical protein